MLWVDSGILRSGLLYRGEECSRRNTSTFYVNRNCQKTLTLFLIDKTITWILQKLCKNGDKTLSFWRKFISLYNRKTDVLNTRLVRGEANKSEVKIAFGKQNYWPEIDGKAMWRVVDLTYRPRLLTVLLTPCVTALTDFRHHP